MSTTPVGTRVRAKVRGRCPHLETAVRKCIFDTDSKREWVAWLWIEHMFHHGSMWLLLDCGPGCPADKTVDCAGGAVRQIRSCHLATGLATGL